jgi:hypothetical protein
MATHGCTGLGAAARTGASGRQSQVLLCEEAT